MKIEEKDVAQAMPGRRTSRRIERNIVRNSETEETKTAETGESEQTLRSMPGRRTARRVERRSSEDSSSNTRPTSVRRRDNRVSEKETIVNNREEQKATEEPMIQEVEVAPVIPANEPETAATEQAEISVEPEKTPEKKEKAPKKKSSGLGGKAIAILVAIVVIIAAIVFGIIFLAGKEKKSSKNFMDQLRTQEIVQSELEPVNQFFTDYYTSLSAGNTTDLEKMFDDPERANVSAGVSTIVEQYSDLEIYLTEGIEEKEYAVFVCNNVKFNNIKTQAPSIDCFYITYSEEDGSVKIKSDMYTNPEIIRFVTLASYMEPMRSKLKETDKALTKALNSDKELKNLYIVMQSMTDAVLSNEAVEQ
ncbi:MAG: hypothetical protein MJ086_05165 [Lachnospiraceae bacterium]|nr:hypothetical protein [Lachnospiraceae bacterium]